MVASPGRDDRAVYTLERTFVQIDGPSDIDRSPSQATWAAIGGEPQSVGVVLTTAALYS